MRDNVDESRGMITVASELSSRKVKSCVSVSRSLRKYFSCFNFYSGYDIDVVDNNSILNIPVVSTILPLAWIAGADVVVDELDKTFVESMEALQQEYKKMYPKAPFNTKIFVDELVENKNTEKNTALLFSGGLDSNYSLFSNIALNPRLIMIFGGDIPISNIPFQELVKKEYSNFARRESLNINFIHTNALEILNRRRVDHFFRKFNDMLEASFLQWMQGSILPLGHAAPLSIGRFNRLLKAATYVEEVAQEFNEYPWDSSPSIDEKIKWGNLQVKHDGCIHRHEKVLALKKTLDEHRVKLRVCMSQPKKMNFSGAMNCGRCEKCLRTIAALIIAGIDPDKCGFSIDVTTFENLRNLFEQKKLSKLYVLLHWKPLQKLILEDVGDRYASEEFFEWFKKIDIDSFTRKSDPLLSVLYYKFPFQISNLVRKIFENSQLGSRA